ncbi:chain length determinant protein EpsF [Hahella aquimaris]|uniref:chain length determinant protein EpsF n=1 Tax=Hahella sp. HNIBRBA332 TaxID=3015983 RepID=UPI00273AD40E|nr:chain length determinant protein EpsF [Hahella sp. HNIBRBA332]WLQ16374.1 chain length determinant protein EpsF [Hahella sp. HNIBRBA332]
MTLKHVLLVLWARRWVVLSVLLATITTTAVVSLLIPKEYTASTTVVLDVQTPDRIVGMVLPGMMSPGYMATQMDIITSDRVAQGVVRLLKLDENPETREKWLEETGGQGTIAVWLAPGLKKSLEVSPARESNVISVEFSATDPRFAATAANAFAQAYIDTTIDLRAEPARKYAAWFEQQYDIQRERLQKAQRALSDFQQKTGIVVTNDRLDFENQKLGELTAQLSLALAEGTDSSSKQGFNQGSDTLPEIMRNPLIIQLKTDIARMDSRLQELSEDYGVNHPQYKSAASELASMKSRLRMETAKIAESISTVGRVSKAKQAELKAAIEAQKKKMLELKSQHDQIQILSHQVETAQRDFDAISQRLTQSQLEAQTVQTNVSILTPASPPLKHSKPMLFLNLVIAVMLGGLLSVGAALILELRNPVVRSIEDLQSALGVPVLAQLSKAPVSMMKQKEGKTDTARPSGLKTGAMAGGSYPLAGEA